MTRRHSRFSTSLLLGCLFLCGSILCGDSYEDWLRAWDDVPAREESGPVAQLVERTRLLEEAITAGLPLDAEMWTRIAEVLGQWEASPEVNTAREAYLSLLTAVCLSAEGQDVQLPDEPALRSYLQRALSLTESNVEEGAFLLFVAESWIRSTTVSTALLRRAESLLQQAITLLDNEQPLDVVHFRLGQLYQRLGSRTGPENSEPGASFFLTRAVHHYQQLEGMSFARLPFREAASRALQELLEPEMEIDLARRFLPDDTIRLLVRSRNLDTVKISLIALPPGEEGVPRTLDGLREVLSAENPDPQQIHYEKSFSTRGRHPHDWKNQQLRLEAHLVGGWYGVRVQAGSVTLNDLLLVSPLEVAVLPRRDGGLLLWASDGETGQVVPGASTTVLAADGRILASATTGMDGLIELPPEGLEEWHEVYFLAGPNPGHVRRVDLPEPEARIPWIVANPSEVQPGGIFHWALLGIDASILPAFEEGPVFHLPDGSKWQSETIDKGPGWLSGSLEIPSGLAIPGPIYADLSPEFRLHVGHVRMNRAHPLDLDISGEQLSGSVNLYHVSSPLGVSITPAFGVQADLPDFIRLQVSRLQREPVINPTHTRQTPPDLLFESILPFEVGAQKESFIELPDFSAGDAIQALKIEVMPLDGVEPLAEAVLGLVPFRRLVELSQNEHVVKAGTPTDIYLIKKTPDAASDRSTEGELVIYRETWQNRYIHRKRGTSLSESEYEALPDRSLLGAAKTDFRLVEEGFIREEVQRLPVKASSSGNAISLQLDQPGCYLIEFVGREVDTAASYPEGPLELWVLPESGELQAFRSDSPRLILESGSDGFLQVLALLDREDTVVLLDVEYEDGTTFTKVSKPDHTALYLELEEPVEHGIAAVRALISGDRQTQFLSGTVTRELPENWELTADNLFGLNPGVEFEWGLRAEDGSGAGPSLWSFYAHDSCSLLPGRLRWQRNQQSTNGHHPQTGACYSSLWLPYANPFMRQSSPQQPTHSTHAVSFKDPGLFLSVFPEVNRFPEPFPPVPPFRPVLQSGPNGQFGMQGNFPPTAGRWDLTLLSANGHHELTVQSWLVSTELPIRSRIEGPATLRPGDRALLPLTLQNTTEKAVVLQLEAMSSEVIKAGPVTPTQVRLDPGETDRVPLEILAVGVGSDNLDVRVEGPGLSSEAVHSVEVMAPSFRNVFSFQMIPAGGALHESAFDVTDWDQIEIVVAPGIGALLPYIWPAIRDIQEPSEALQTSLCQWAMERVLHHHGEISAEAFSITDQALNGMLEESQLESGGWGWFPEGAADPWLSAFVLWTLEMFAEPGDTDFEDVLTLGQAYLERVLIDDSVEMVARLFALRALAASAFHSDEARPSRIQARTFLEFLHQQTNLTDAQVATLLQVAKAYQFKQEVALLRDELITRRMDTLSFWPASLVYLGLDDSGSEPDAGSHGRLQQALLALSADGPAQSWEQLAGFLNLLAAYYWNGDFFADGEVSVGIAGAAQGVFALNPGIGGDPVLRIPVAADALTDAKVNYQVDMAEALSPVLVAAIGHSVAEKQSPRLDSVSINYFREFSESTLLQGTRNRSIGLDGTLDGIHAGDTLRIRLSFELPEAQALTRFRFPVPAGMRLEAEGINHVAELDTNGDMTRPPVQKLLRKSSPSGTQILSMGPLSAGRHLISLAYEVDWAGDFEWPECLMLKPRSGETYQLLENRRIQILPDEE